jgi:hypothetical protein
VNLESSTQGEADQRLLALPRSRQAVAVATDS